MPEAPELVVPTVAQLVTEVAENIRSLKAGGRLLQEVDVTRGY